MQFNEDKNQLLFEQLFFQQRITILYFQIHRNKLASSGKQIRCIMGDLKIANGLVCCGVCLFINQFEIFLHFMSITVIIIKGRKIETGVTNKYK